MVQEVTTIGWGKRIINAFGQTVIGLVLFIGAFFLIFWNEGHGLHVKQSLQQVADTVINVSPTPIDLKNDLHVVYLQGLATTNYVLQDTLFGVSENAIKLDRKSEMYQWQENIKTTTEKQTGGSERETKTFTYELIWSEKLIDSSAFKQPDGHQNPVNMPILSQYQVAEKVMVGDYYLSKNLINQISGTTPVDLSKIDVGPLQASLKKPVKHDADGIYIGDAPQDPKVGDMKITITKVLPQIVSIIAEQSSDNLQPYMAPAGQPVCLLAMGQKSPQQMIAEAQSANSTLIWALRLLSLVMLVSGLALFMAPLTVFADFVPFFGLIVRAGTVLMAFAIGVLLWTITIAIAWFTVRPFLSIGLIIAALVIVFGVIHYAKKSGPTLPS